MSPDAGVADSFLDGNNVFAEQRRMILRPEIKNRLGQKFVTRIAIHTNRRVIHRQKSQRLHVQHPHWMWVTVEEQGRVRLSFFGLRAAGLGLAALAPHTETESKALAELVQDSDRRRIESRPFRCTDSQCAEAPTFDL